MAISSILTPAAGITRTRIIGQLPARIMRRMARENHTAVWTGSEMIVWGGFIDEFFEDLTLAGD